MDIQRRLKVLKSDTESMLYLSVFRACTDMGN